MESVTQLKRTIRCLREQLAGCDLTTQLGFTAQTQALTLSTNNNALSTDNSTALVSSTLNVTGYYIGFVMQVATPDGLPVTVDTSSSIWFSLNTGVLADPGTTYRIGIQDVDMATGNGDGTFDVYADLVGGVDTLSSGPNEVQFTSGSKVLNHGDLIAVEFRAISRAGADTFRLNQWDSYNYHIPYRYYFNGALAKSSSMGAFIIRTADNKFIMASQERVLIPYAYQNMPVGSPTMEAGAVFSLPFDGYLSSLVLSGFRISGVGRTTLYSTPTTSPTVVATITDDADMLVSGYSDKRVVVFPEYPLLTAGVEYGIGITPLTPGQDMDTYVMDYGTGLEVYKDTTQLGQNWSYMTRADNTGGAFTAVPGKLPIFSMQIKPA